MVVDPSEVDVRQEVAFHGFAALMHGYGFRRISKISWRLELDELVWNVGLIPGYKDAPGSFNIIYGTFVHGLDEIAERVDGKPMSHKMQGLSARAHIEGDVGKGVYTDQVQAYNKKERIPPPPGMSFRERVTWRIRDFFVKPDFETEILDMPYWGRAGVTSTATAFMPKLEKTVTPPNPDEPPGILELLDIRAVEVPELTRAVCGYFEQDAWPFIDRHRTFLSHFQDYWMPKTERGIHWDCKENFVASIMANRIDLIEQAAEAQFAFARQSAEDILFRESSVRRENYKELPEEKKIFLMQVNRLNLKANELHRAREMVEVAGALDVTLPHDFDFTEIERLRKEADANAKVLRP